jgi:hypothetical protein
MNTLAITRRNVIVPFASQVEAFGQTLTVIGKASITDGDEGREFGDIEFTAIGINGYSEKLKEIVFTLLVNVKDLSYKQLFELETALVDQCSDSIFETLANRD